MIGLRFAGFFFLVASFRDAGDLFRVFMSRS